MIRLSNITSGYIQVKFFILLCCVVLCCSVSFADEFGNGTQYCVDSTEDVVEIDGCVTLREAILAANSNTAVNEAPAGSDSETDVIMFSDDVDIADWTILLNGTHLNLEDDISIVGPAKGYVTIDAQEQSNIFEIYNSGMGVRVNAHLQNMYLTGGKSQQGGAVDSCCSEVLIKNCIISDNIAGNYGGGINFWMGDLTIENSEIISNDAYHGGGIYYNNAGVRLKNCVLYANEASHNGGGICGEFSESKDFYLVGTVIAGNIAQDTGGGIYCVIGNPQFVNCTIVENTAGVQCGGIYQEGAFFNIDGFPNVNMLMTNTILFGNESPIDPEVRRYADILAHNCIITFWPGFYGLGPGSDGIWGTDDDAANYSLYGGSMAIDRGNVELAVDYNGQPILTDVTGAARVSGNTIDIGAYEYYFFPGDINTDRSVDLEDFLILKANYGIKSGATNAQGDVDYDGDVDIFDFLVLKAYYLK